MRVSDIYYTHKPLCMQHPAWGRYPGAACCPVRTRLCCTPPASGIQGPAAAQRIVGPWAEKQAQQDECFQWQPPFETGCHLKMSERQNRENVNCVANNVALFRLFSFLLFPFWVATMTLSSVSSCFTTTKSCELTIFRHCLYIMAIFIYCNIEHKNVPIYRPLVDLGS